MKSKHDETNAQFQTPNYEWDQAPAVTKSRSWDPKPLLISLQSQVSVEASCPWQLLSSCWELRAQCSYSSCQWTGAWPGKKQHHTLSARQTSRLSSSGLILQWPKPCGCSKPHNSPELAKPPKVSVSASAQDHRGTVSSLLVGFKSKLCLPMAACNTPRGCTWCMPPQDTLDHLSSRNQSSQ